MRRALFVALIGLVGGGPGTRADDPIPLKTLTEIKSATVFVKVEFTGPGLGKVGATGSGFLMRVDGDTGYLVTNHHVISSPSPRLVLAGPPTLVFWSGTKKEQSVRADIVASDPSRDLAILKVSKFKDLPAAIDLSQKVELVETMSVYVFGFPFGEALSTTKGNPAMTVGKGSVSSIRENEFGQVAVVQIDGDVNPGNSGGPVVDKQGRLVGVAVARIRDSRIGMAVPSGELAGMLNGRVGGLTLTVKKVDNGAAEVEADARLIDPMNKIRSVSVRAVRADALKEKLKPDKNGRWPVLPGSQKVELKVDQQKASGTLQFSAPERGTVTFAFQTCYVNGEGQTIYTGPGQFRVDFGQATVARPVPDLRGPEVNEGGEVLAGPSREIGDLAVTELKLNVAGVPRCLCWAPGDKAFLVLDGNGALRRVRLGDFREEMRAGFGRKPSWLSVSAEGLVVTLADLQELWVLDPQTFKVKQKFASTSVSRAVSAPLLPVAIAVGRDTLTTFDLKTGTPGKQYRQQDLGPSVGFGQATVTPDGKYLFTMGGAEQLHRFRLNTTELVLEESSPRIAKNGQAIEVSPDSKYVCLPSGGGNYAGLKDHPEVSPYSTYIYPVTDINRPEFAIHQGAYPRAVGFDPKAGLIYAQNFDHQLIRFGMTGAKQKECQLDGGDTRQLLAHPQGGKLLVLTGSKLYHVELIKK